MNKMGMMMAAALCSAGCTLIVGTETRVVGDAGADAAATDAAPSCPSSRSCTDPLGPCKSHCASVQSDCEEEACDDSHDPKCKANCQSASKSCTDGCVSACVSCASTPGCPPIPCK